MLFLTPKPNSVKALKAPSMYITNTAISNSDHRTRAIFQAHIITDRLMVWYGKLSNNLHSD